MTHYTDTYNPTRTVTWTAGTTSDYSYLNIYTGTADAWGIRVPEIRPDIWEHYERPEASRQIDASHINEAIDNLREEMQEKMTKMMNTLMEQVMQVIVLLPRNGGDIPPRKGVICICGNFIPEGKENERCEYCGK